VPWSAATLEQGVPLDCLDGNAKSFQTYESNVLFALRFMVDTDIVGGNWVRLRATPCIPAAVQEVCQAQQSLL
jgi:hypothetical protein